MLIYLNSHILVFCTIASIKMLLMQKQNIHHHFTKLYDVQTNEQIITWHLQHRKFNFFSTSKKPNESLSYLVPFTYLYKILIFAVCQHLLNLPTTPYHLLCIKYFQLKIQILPAIEWDRVSGGKGTIWSNI